ncbi:hypothetical protein [Rheinheimera fenheensis]|uniref:hypothetical protein n=1 Tax=Rheinheimera fenheensis TaxID=3152295 RepID=UPI00325E1A9B
MLKKMIASFCCLVLTACASNTIKTTRIDQVKQLSDGHGVVALQLVNNTERLSRYHADWTEVLAVRLDNRDQLREQAIAAAKAKAEAEKKRFDEAKVDWSPDIYTLAPSAEGVVSSQLFVGTMPAGEYMIAGLYAHYSDGNVSAWIQMPVRHAAGVFHIKPAELTSLGTLVFQPLLDVKSESFWSNSSSQKAFVTRVPEQALTDYVLAKYPHLRPSLNVAQPLTWQPDGFDNLRQQLAEEAQKNAWGNLALPLSHHGHAALMSRFGLLHYLDKQGDWHSTKLDTNAQLTSVVDAPDYIAVGAERGQLFVASSWQSGWQKYTPVSSAEAIVWLRKGADRYYAMTQSSSAFTVYQTTSLQQGWQQIGQFKRKEFSFLVQYGGVFAFIDQQGQLKVLNDSELNHYDETSGQWRKNKAQAMVKLTQLVDGSLLGVAVSQWDGIGDQQLSVDDGASWQPLRRNLGIFGDRAAEAGLAAKLADGTLVTLSRERDSAKQSSQMYLMSAEGGKLNVKSSWQRHGAVREDCNILLPELTYQQTLHLLCTEGDIISTSDLGQNWQTVRDVDIGALQHRFEQLVEAMQQQAKQAASSL